VAPDLSQRRAALDKAATVALEAERLAGDLAAMYLFHGQDEAAHIAGDCANRCMDAVRLAVRAGAADPVERKGDAQRLDLRDLAALDTPQARALLAGLRELLPLAEVVDAQRGRSVGEEVPLQPDESRGTDLAETISEMVLRLRRECEGARGRE
jgi:hypothetical protein